MNESEVTRSTRRDALKIMGASLGGALLGDRLEASTPTSSIAPVSSARLNSVNASSASPMIASLQSYLQANASPSFSLPPLMTSPPQVSWAGPMSAWPVPTSLPNGIAYPVSGAAFGGPIRSRFTANLSGNPTLNGIPALRVARPYLCKGTPCVAGSPNVIRFGTDAAVIELAGIVLPESYTSQTLIVNGQLVPSTVVSVSNGLGGGWNAVGVRIDFGSSTMRDIWIETGIYLAYVKLGQSDTLLPATDAADPQITVVGDSYLSYGSNAFGNGAAIALELGARLGMGKVAVDAVIGSGYWNSGYNRGNFNDRVLAHAADNSTIYLVLGGLNDYGDYVPNVVWPTRAQYEGAVASYYQALRAAQPNALIAVTAPFCPNPTLSDASYVQYAATNSSGLGDFTYKAQVQKTALAQIAGPWIWIDVLMGGGWLNSSAASGGSSGLQWFTGGIAAAGTNASNKPGNLAGGSGGGFGGIGSVPVLSGGKYSQAPEITASGGSGSGLLLSSTIDATGALKGVTVVQPGVGYTSGVGLPTLSISTTFQQSAATLGAPVPINGVNPTGNYPLAAFAPASSPGGYSNSYVLLTSDLVHPSPAGVDYLASRLAQSLYEAVMAL